jgi:hypothetical protein
MAETETGTLTAYGAIEESFLLAEEFEEGGGRACEALGEYKVRLSRAIARIRRMGAGQERDAISKLLHRMLDHAEKLKARVPVVPTTPLPQPVRQEDLLQYVTIGAGESAPEWDTIDPRTRAALMELVVLPVQRPDLFGVGRSVGPVLLFGVPGVGKSAIAGSMAARFAEITVVRLVIANAMRSWDAPGILAAADAYRRAHRPCVLFLDELECLPADPNAALNLTIETILASDSDGVVLVTQSPWNLPRALWRFRKVLVDLPDHAARVAIIRRHAHSMPNANGLFTNAELELTGSLTEGFTAADISILMRDTAMNSLRALMKATHFRLTRMPAAATEQWVACKPTDPGAVETTIMELPPDRLFIPPLVCLHFPSSPFRKKSSPPTHRRLLIFEHASHIHLFHHISLNDKEISSLVVIEFVHMCVCPFSNESPVRCVWCVLGTGFPL